MEIGLNKEDCNNLSDNSIRFTIEDGMSLHRK